MKLSNLDIRRIIQEEAEAMDAVVGGGAGEPEPPTQQLDPAAAQALASLPEPQPEAEAVVRGFGLYTELDENGEMSVGKQLAGFLTMLEQKTQGTIEKLQSPEAAARLIQALGDAVTVEILDITGINLEGVPSKRQHKGQ